MFGNTVETNRSDSDIRSVYMCCSSLQTQIVCKNADSPGFCFFAVLLTEYSVSVAIRVACDITDPGEDKEKRPKQHR